MKLRPLAVRCVFALALAGAASAHAAEIDAAQRQAWREQARWLEHGEGVPRDTDAAIALYCRAALAGDADSAYNLGWIYANGRGTPRHDGYAAHWFARAALLGDTQAEAMFKRMDAPAEKPNCVLQAERVEQQLAEQTAKAAAEAAETEALTTRYREWVNTPEQQRIMKIVYKLAPQFGIEPGLAFAVIRAESNFNVNALSDKNAQGLMQLIPETAARFAVRKPFDAEQNIRGGLSYLRWLLAYFKGNVPLVLAAYNAGEGTVERYKGVPPFPETQGYIKRIQQVFSLQTHPFDERVTAPSPVVGRVTATIGH
ncbi:transglycosylase SLT domain-containing protein [Hydrogenophaga sp. BPS33]|uniref:transglycosylase SLT domain-containing protein n=1 Tax=Hydrogenophaga sp. BPS33 TaxID=2651974 RepID=UPI0013202F13|nr:transglycosylase SLT domain-containing protein [Hydrogenophaga sp. BPS33]QHE86959.1 transglycosylase SLT domain-containing protein [Hydrogenophaga sp. BPS33]